MIDSRQSSQREANRIPPQKRICDNAAQQQPALQAVGGQALDLARLRNPEQRIGAHAHGVWPQS